MNNKNTASSDEEQPKGKGHSKVFRYLFWFIAGWALIGLAVDHFVDTANYQTQNGYVKTPVTAQELVEIELQRYTLPHKIDTEFYVFDVQAKSTKEIVYSIQAANYKASQFDWSEFGPRLKQVMVNDHCKTDAKDSDIVFTYEYFDKVKKAIGSYSITKEDCM